MKFFNRWAGTITTFLALLAVTMLAACYKPEKKPDPAVLVTIADSGGQEVLRDRETGCQYIWTYGSLTIRYDRSGQPMCEDTGA